MYDLVPRVFGKACTLEGKIQINRFGYRLHGQLRRELGMCPAGGPESPRYLWFPSVFPSRKYISCVEMEPRISAYCQGGMERPHSTRISDA